MSLLSLVAVGTSHLLPIVLSRRHEVLPRIRKDWATWFRLSILLIGIATSTSIPAKCQLQPTMGATPFQMRAARTYDSISLSDLGVSLDIPVINKPGVMPFKYDLIQESDAGFPLTGMYSHQTNVINSGYVLWTQDSAGALTLSSSLSLDSNNCAGQQLRLASDQDPTGYYSYLTIVDPSGGQHVVWAQGSTLTSSTPFKVCASKGGSATATGITLDSSGYTITVTVNAATGIISYTLVDALHGYTTTNPNGNLHFSGTGPWSNAVTITDPNGNIVTATTTYPATNGTGSTTVTTWTDATNTNVMIVTSTWWVDGNCAAILGSPVPCPQGYEPTSFVYHDGNSNPEEYSVAYSLWQWSPIQTGIGSNILVDIPFPNGITLPDGSTFAFSYNTVGTGSNITNGFLTSMATPLQETISYYVGWSQKLGSAAWEVQRTGVDGTWIYDEYNNSGTFGPTVIYAPSLDTTYMYFQQANSAATFPGTGAPQGPPAVSLALPGYIESWQGYVPSNSYTLLSTHTLCYNNYFYHNNQCASPGTSQGCGASLYGGYVYCYPVTSQYNYSQLGSNGSPSLSVKTYDGAYERQLEEKDYDFGATVPPTGSAVADTVFQWGTYTNGTCSNISSSINDRVCITQVKDGSGTTLTQTNDTYDSHGNLLSVAHLAAGSTYQTASFIPNANGTVSTINDVNGATTTVVNSACNNTLPTKISVGGISKSFTWNCTTAEVTSETDANSAVTNFSYNDPFWGVTSVSDPLKNVTNYSYGVGRSYRETSLLFNGGKSILDTRITTDAAGRDHVIQVSQGPGSSGFDTTTMKYDSNGRQSFVSLPCVETVWGTPCSGSSGISYSYDALNRSTNTSNTAQPTPGQVTQTYAQSDVLIVSTPASSGENVKQEQSEYDGLGRLSSVCEITGSANGGYTCSQTSAQTGYWTRYKYDALGRLIGVCQKTTQPLTVDCVTTPSVGQQTRTYSYDGMGRLTAEANPESGTKSYVYDSVGTNYCGSSTAYASTGDLVATADANGNHLCYLYDTLHRLTDVTNNVQSSTNFCKRFRYDNSSGVLGSVPSGVSVKNGMGRLVEAETDTCASPITQASMITDEWFSYDADGRITDVWELTPHSGQYYHAIATFFGNGEVNTIQLASPSLYTMTWGVDGEGRWTTLTDTTAGKNLVTGATFYPAANPEVVKLTGNTPDNDSYTIDPNSGYVSKFVFTVGNTPSNMTGQLTWNANGTVSQLSVTDGFNAGGTQTCNYNPTAATGTGYDDLGRLVGVDCGSGQWGQTFNYDPYGNLSKSVISGRTGTNWSPGYSPTTNHYACSGCTYDANGDVTNDGNNTYGWDVYSKLRWIATSPGSATCGTSGRCIVYDAFGRVVERSNGTTWYEQWVTQLGGTAWMSGATQNFAVWPAPAGGTVVMNGTTNWAYLHKDWLGTGRITSSLTNNNVVRDQSYSPYGELYDTFGSAGSQYTEFGGLTGNIDYGVVWDTPNRELSVVGRWLSPDPAGINSADPTNPQSWNRYAYINGNPLSGTDPTGLDSCSVSIDSSDDGGSASATCDISFNAGSASPPDLSWSGSSFDPCGGDPWCGHAFAQQVLTQPVLTQAANTMNTVTAVYGIGFAAAGAAAGGSVVGVGTVARLGYTYYAIYGAPLVASIGCEELCSGMSPFPTLQADSSAALAEAEEGMAPAAKGMVPAAATAGPRIYRGSATMGNANHVRDKTGFGVSFRDSLSEPLPRQAREVFPLGKNWIAVDPTKLPAGSVVYDAGQIVGGRLQPPGHVSVYASPEEIVNATEAQGQFK